MAAIQAELYEITPCPIGRLAVMPRPRGGDWLMPELASLKLRGVTDIVSLLQPAEVGDLGLEPEPDFCETLLMRFHHHPIKDHGLPVQPAFDQFVDSLLPYLGQGGFLAIHCRGGFGRSPVLAAALLCRLGVSAEEAIERISLARGIDVPETEEQIDFIYGLEKPSM
jgi:protein-tyrosine phosphatase